MYNSNELDLILGCITDKTLRASRIKTNPRWGDAVALVVGDYLNTTMLIHTNN
jgi:hypothetical protein